MFGKNKKVDSVKPLTPLQRYVQEGAVIVGSRTITDGFVPEIRPAGSPSGKSRIVIGEDCVVAGAFILENDGGKVRIGNRTFIGGGRFISIAGIEIGDDVMFSWGCTLMDNDAHSLDWQQRVNDVADWKRGLDEKKIGAYKNWEAVDSAPIVVGNRAWIGFNVIILKGITIGEGAVVAAGSVVTKDVAPYTLVAGNPARYIKDLQK